MRKYLVMMLVAGLVAAVAAPAPAARKARTVTKTYDSTPTRGGFSTWVDGRYVMYVGESVKIRTKLGDRSVTVAVKDDSGNPVAFGVWVGDGDGQLFCKRSKPLAIYGGAIVSVRPMVEITPTGGVCATPAMTTTGTIKATIR